MEYAIAWAFFAVVTMGMLHVTDGLEEMSFVTKIVIALYFWPFVIGMAIADIQNAINKIANK